MKHTFHKCDAFAAFYCSVDEMLAIELSGCSNACEIDECAFDYLGCKKFQGRLFLCGHVKGGGKREAYSSYSCHQLLFRV